MCPLPPVAQLIPIHHLLFDTAAAEPGTSMTSLGKPAQIALADADASPSKHERQDQYSVFSAATRTYLTYFLGISMTLSTLTATVYFPLIPMLSDDLHVSIEAINLTITVYAAVQAVSPGPFAPIADSFGRRPVFLVLAALYALGGLGLMLNKTNYATLLTLRALQSVGGSPMSTLAYGIVVDVVRTAERGRMLGPMLSISAVGPVIGGAVAHSMSGVEFVFLALFIISVFCLLVAGFTLPETARCVVGNGSKPATGIWKMWWSLIRRGRHQDTDPIPEVSDPQNTDQERWHIRTAFTALQIHFYKDAAAVLWIVALTYSVYYTFQVAIPVIFADIYFYNELEIGLVFLSGLAGMTIGGVIAGKLIDVNYATVVREQNHHAETDPHTLGDFPVEAARYRNCLVFVAGQVILVIGYGWSVQYRTHPSLLIILQFFICATSTLLSHTASALLVDIFPEQSSTAYASGQMMRCGVSAVSAIVLQPLVSALGYGWYFTAFALCIGICAAACVLVSRVKGKLWSQKRCSR